MPGNSPAGTRNAARRGGGGGWTESRRARHSPRRPRPTGIAKTRRVYRTEMENNSRHTPRKECAPRRGHSLSAPHRPARCPGPDAFFLPRSTGR
ncbi:hypothetical protein GWI33_019519 [Rhynchophorus ferrugineus]|uniref:Uncharacterized protein n=1 Tax=Rhynchophorus ferrugineus TaxID=354439 RepID=A0A834I577_RHYFE|nr:hypothetical protein GWI33_019519 [Rhynchophorus ferrugineus]